jgi:hypothetical protein
MKGRGETGHRIWRLIDHVQLKALSYWHLALDIKTPIKYRTKNGFLSGHSEWIRMDSNGFPTNLGWRERGEDAQ